MSHVLCLLVQNHSSASFCVAFMLKSILVQACYDVVTMLLPSYPVHVLIFPGLRLRPYPTKPVHIERWILDVDGITIMNEGLAVCAFDIGSKCLQKFLLISVLVKLSTSKIQRPKGRGSPRRGTSRVMSMAGDPQSEAGHRARSERRSPEGSRYADPAR